MGANLFSYEGRTALIVGGATGMGQAAAQIVKDLGGRVIVMDYADVTDPVDQAIKVDLRSRASVDSALTEITTPIDAVFSCAGVAQGTPGLMLVNFISHRHIIETLFDDDRLARGAGITIVSSVGGLGWENRLDTINEFLDTEDWETAQAWMEAHPEYEGYGFSKQAVNVYVRRRSHPFLFKGVRINAIEPGPTDTPLAQANTWLEFADDYRSEAGASASTPTEQAYPMAFLNSRAASHVSGTSMLVDLGYVGSALVGAYDAPVVHAIMGHQTSH